MIRALPNILTLARIAAVPAVVAALFISGETGRFWALVIFLLASITDFFDGYLARKLDAQSRFGTMLDPIADKLLVATVLIMLILRGTVQGLDSIAILLILGREIFISGLREFLAGERVSLPVTMLAKWKTTVQMLAIVALLAFGEMPGIGADLARAALWLAAALSLWTGAQYTLAAMKPPRTDIHA
jgi:CDP-diacylglycerol--glycerol-3-phosphate 3-phosphatidyltransferase